MKRNLHFNDDDNECTLNQSLVDELKRKGCLRSRTVEAAFRAVLRHWFLPNTPLEDVYSDQVISTKIIDEQSVSSSSQPAMMAFMLEQLDLKAGHKVLEIGAGTGYNAALMSHIVGATGQVITVDIDADLVAGARQHLEKAGCDRALAVCGDGGYGHADLAPYDRIILTVSAADITPAWWDQLKRGGRLLLPLSIQAGTQVSVAFQRVEDHLEHRSISPCMFMELRGAFAGVEGQFQLGTTPGLTRIAKRRKLVTRLTERIRTWNAVGRPSLEDFTIKAYPIDCEYQPEDNEVVLARRWTKFVFRWSNSA